MKKQITPLNARKVDFYILLFFLLAFLGWLWEVGIYLFTRHAFVNRGIYYGPYLPIYGIGGLLLWFLLQKWSRRPITTFFLSALICSVLEYGASVFLEWKWGLRWWDYSSFFLNLGGRICLAGALCFGLGGMLLNCFLLPWYMRLYHRIPPVWRLILCGFLLTVFLLDITYCAVSPNTGRDIAW
ncbi:MAG: putative ABC transporter permease [bacterium]|nr:putative ABC transporter permease [bacterium]